MGNPSWLLAIASIIAVVGVVIVFKPTIARIQAKGEHEEKIDLQQELSPFLLKVSMIEIVPIILVAFGAMQISELTGINFLFPLVLILGALLFGLLMILLSRQEVINNPRISQKGKMLISVFCMIVLSFVTAIPLISVILILVTQL